MADVKEKIILTLVKMVGKTSFKPLVIGVKSIAIAERDQPQLQIQQGQAVIYSKGAG